jgi:hydrogenase expression/formation protein HypC
MDYRNFFQEPELITISSGSSLPAIVLTISPGTGLMKLQHPGPDTSSGCTGLRLPYPYHCFYVVGLQNVLDRYFRGSSMCVAVPAEVLEIRDGNIGLVDYGDLKQEVRLDLVDVKVGEFVLVHVGFAIQRLSREEGIETRDIFKQVYAALEE